MCALAALTALAGVCRGAEAGTPTAGAGRAVAGAGNVAATGADAAVLSSYEENVRIVRRFLDEEKVKYEIGRREGEDTGFSIRFNSRSEIYDTIESRVAVTESGRVTGVSVFPAAVGRAKTAEMLEFITRANHGLTYGAFEFDRSDGRVAFRFVWPDGILHGDGAEARLSRLVYLTPRMIDNYAKGFALLLLGQMSPGAAVRIGKENDER